MMSNKASFPTILHKEVAEIIRDYFLKNSLVDTVLLVNSCARGKAVPESDLDFAILVKPDTTKEEIKIMEQSWCDYTLNQKSILKFKNSHQFAHIHLDIIEGIYTPQKIEIGEPIDYFEIEIGNQICYSAPMGNIGDYFIALKSRWLPYYNEELRIQRLTMVKNACEYDIEHIPIFVKRDLYFQAFDILYKALHEYLQALFIANKMYPIAYNKWIKDQVANQLDNPILYSQLCSILSISNFEGNDIIDNSRKLKELLNDLR